MAIACTLNDVKGKLKKVIGNPETGVEGNTLVAEFFGAQGGPGSPHATYNEFEPGRTSHPHYHALDQFQVAIGGKARIGRHDMETYSVHFSKAYTPYGPFIASKDAGLTCFNLHARSDIKTGSYHLPAEAETLKQIPNRHPWQITTEVVFAKQASGLCEIPGLSNDSGLAGYSVSLAPSARQASTPVAGEGQYVVIVEGSVVHDNKELKAPALVFVYPQDQSYLIHAGSGGAKALVLNFPVDEYRHPAKTSE